MRIVFMGTPDFAVPSLRALVDHGYEVVGVFCQPDRPKGRGHKLAACPVKELAQSAGIPVFQPERIKREEGVAMLKSCAPDLCVTAAFGQLLSQEILDIPPLGTINVHSSLLPKHRGSAPINWSIIKGDPVTGVTTMFTDKGMDTGDILLTRETPIGSAENAGELTDRLAVMGAQLLIETIRAIEAGTLARTPQDHAAATYEPKMDKELGRIDWSKSAQELDWLVRGTTPWPGAFTTLGEQTIKVFELDILDGPASGAPGEIVAADAKRGLVVSCGDHDVALAQIQMPGAKRMNAKDYLRGHTMETGVCLGKA
ncbi:MAG: methionyl-tRNA formyltransferase [Candidatus Ventricola sp.]|nr:methionyl-tRNA formyltransferase [Candidatus Ventricola sp.]